MHRFLYLEGAYLVLAAVILAVTLFVTTRPFMSKGALKKGMISVSVLLALLIGTHYLITMQRIEAVKRAFYNNQPIICESKMLRKVAQSIILQRSLGWSLVDDKFVSKAYTRPFFIARCIPKE